MAVLEREDVGDHLPSLRNARGEGVAVYYYSLAS